MGMLELCVKEITEPAELAAQPAAYPDGSCQLYCQIICRNFSRGWNPLHLQIPAGQRRTDWPFDGTQRLCSRTRGHKLRRKTASSLY